MARIEELRKIIGNHQRRLNKLREQQAVSGTDTRPDVLIEIEDLETALDGLQGELEAEVSREAAVKRSYSQLETGPMGEVLLSIREQIGRLEVSDPRLEMLRRQLFDLSIMTDELQERVRSLESHERAGLTIARAVAIAVFVVVVVAASRYI